MDMFEKVKNVGESVVDSAKSLGGAIINVSKEQSSIAGMKVQKSVIEKHLQEYYAEIGKRYLSYTNNSDGGEAFDISDILEKIQPELDKLSDITASLGEKELEAKQEEERKIKQKVQNEYDTEKAKLEKALEMDIIEQSEYEKKLAAAQKKLDCYEQIRKIDMQLKMEIISKEEHKEKVDKLLQE